MRMGQLSKGARGEEVLRLHKQLATLGFKVGKASRTFSAATVAAVRAFQREHTFPVTGVVDARTAAALGRLAGNGDKAKKAKPAPPFIVKGTIRRPDGTPLSGVAVRAFDATLRGEENLGDATTGKGGEYEITYTGERLRRLGKSRPDLRIRVYAANGERQLLVESATLFGAEADVTVDLTPPASVLNEPSEYERLVAKLTPALRGVEVADLENEDVTFAAGATGLPVERIAALAVAARIARRTGVSPAVVYGLLGGAIPQNIGAIFSRTPEDLKVAIRAAVEDHRVPAYVEGQIDRAVNGLRKDALKRILQPDKDAPASPVGEVLAKVLPDADLQTAFLRAYTSYNGTIESFWETLRADRKLGEVADQVQLASQLASLTKSNQPLIQALLRRGGHGRLTSVRELSALDERDWLDILTGTSGSPIAPPEGTPGEDPDERRRNYAAIMTRMLEDAYPVPALAARIAKDRTSVLHTPELLDFFARNVDVDLATIRVNEFVEHHAALDRETDRNVLEAQLVRLQRVFKITYRFKEVNRLLADGLHSACHIGCLGRSTFTARYAEEFGRRRTKVIFARAHHVSTMAVALFARHAASLNTVAPQMMAGHPDAVAGIPDWATLFGSLDLCDCEHCRSVSGPAAYFADLLNFLRQHGPVALDGLRARRPDLTQLKLSCENTNLPLPYIDLVNEVLEIAILAGSDPPRPAAPQTQSEGTASERLAHPQHIYADVYDTDLKAAIFPWQLPFDLWTEEARTYLDHLGVTRAHIMEACFAGEISDRLRDPSITAEFLRLINIGQNVLTGTPLTPPRAAYEFWGFPADPPPLNWIQTLGDVALMLRRSELTYKELIELLDVRFVDPANTIDIDAPGGTCDITLMRIANVDEPALDRIQRFLRLRRTLNWTTRDLDRVIRAFSPVDGNNQPTITTEFLAQLSHVVRLAGSTGIPPAIVANWWSPTLDTRSYRTPGLDDSISLYDQIFLNRSVSETALSTLALAEPNRTELADTTRTLAADIPSIVGALQITEIDLALIVAAEFPPQSDGSPTTAAFVDLNLANLTRVFRVASCAKALGLSVPDFLSLQALTRLGLFDPAHTENVLLFADTARKLARGPFSIAELDYILRHSDRPGSGANVSEEELTQGLEDLRNGLRQISEQESALRERLVREKLAVVLRLESAVTEPILRTWVHSTENAGQSALTTFLALADVPPDTQIARDSAQFRTLVRLQKIARLISGFRLRLDEVTWAFEKGSARGWLNFDQLPVASPDPFDPTLFYAWERLFDYVLLRNTLPAGNPTLISVFDGRAAATRDDLLRALSVRAGWTFEDLNFLTAHFNYAYPDDFGDERFLARLAPILAIAKRLGASAAHVVDWSSADLTETQARAIKQTAKAKYDNAQWLAIARPLRDVLRDRQREALVAFLLANPQRIGQQGLRDAKDLYEHFLLDVEMSPCMLTSRLVQAIAAVQLFIQRSLIGVESAVQLTAEDVRDWQTWMKNYRLWEANRKVFLYPENWIEPELRDDKSELFQQVETRLLQDDVTADLVEDAYADYLAGLDTIARLEICGVFYEREADDGLLAHSALHVFGRTRGYPHRYYYRQLLNETTWTPWQLVDVEIEGDHLLPVVYNRRLYLFWPQFLEGAVEPTIAKNDPPNKPDRFDEVRLAWTELRHGVWTSRRTSEATLRHNYYDGAADRTRIFFRAELDAATNDLLIGMKFTHTVGTDSDEVVHEVLDDRFRISGSDGTVTADGISLSSVDPMPLPAGSDVRYQAFIERAGDHALKLPYDDGVGSGPDFQRTLQKTPDTFRMDCAPDPVRLWQFQSQGPFFYGDKTRTFFVTCHHARVSDPETPPHVSLRPDRTYLEAVPHLFTVYADKLFPPVPGASLPNPPPDVPIAARTYPVVTASVPLGVALEPPPLTAGGVSERTELLINVGRAAPRDALTAGRMSGIAADVDGALVAVNKANIPRFPDSRFAPRYRFETFYHPYVRTFRREFNRHGVDGLLTRDLQRFPHFFLVPPDQALDFAATYAPYEVPSPVVEAPYPIDSVDFRHGAPYALYNWELFFHVPFLIATRLSQNRQFAAAQRWFHYIFDPTDASPEQVPQRYWRTLPLFANAASLPIQDLMKLLDYNGDDPEMRRLKQDLDAQVDAWRHNAFEPHVLAGLRPAAYQKAVVMRYVDNLIAWGDDLFRQDTRESVNEAAQLYVFAADILGRRPEIVPSRDESGLKSFDDLIADGIDSFSNAIIQLEGQLPPAPTLVYGNDGNGGPAPVAVLGPSLYFCIPKNRKLLGYWETVDDRLFKIRHCMNIEGVVRQLPLFDGPIDPGLLARAAAAGVSVEEAINATLTPPLPHYRFATMIQKANELCSDLRALGGAMLSAIEKRDAEAMALLRSTHEIALLSATRLVREQQVNDAQSALDALRKTREMTVARQRYYLTRPYLNEKEREHLSKAQAAFNFQSRSQELELAAGAVALIPQFKVGSSGPFGTPVVTSEIGGQQLNTLLQCASRALNYFAALRTHQGTVASIVGGHDRRMDDWTFQGDQAGRELQQIDKQIVGAEIRLAITNRELQNLDLQVDNAKAVDEFMRDKFTNRELYDWMVSQLSGVFFQSYQLAYDLAKRAERAFQFEIGDDSSSFLQPGYWDTLKRGLLAGETLSYDLKRMEMAFLDRNRREYEITKHVSLALMDPEALIRLRTTGECFVDLPEVLFDLDYPGHYMRRLKSVSLSIPCVTGPYTGVHCTLTLERNSVRRNADVGASYVRTGDDDPRFQDAVGAIQSIVTSGGSNDGGLFESNLRDERYLPYEGAGADSEWHLELPPDCNNFDFSTITDVVLHVRYTARDGGPLLREAAREAIVAAFPKKGVQLFSARSDFSNGWSAFAHAGGGTLSMPFGEAGRFASQYRGHAITITKIDVFLRLKDAEPYPTPLTLSIKPPASAARSFLLERDSDFGDAPRASHTFGDGIADGAWTLAGAPTSIAQSEAQDIYLLVSYTVA